MTSIEQVTLLANHFPAPACPTADMQRWLRDTEGGSHRQAARPLQRQRADGPRQSAASPASIQKDQLHPELAAGPHGHCRWDALRQRVLDKAKAARGCLGAGPTGQSSLVRAFVEQVPDIDHSLSKPRRKRLAAMPCGQPLFCQSSAAHCEMSAHTTAKDPAAKEGRQVYSSAQPLSEQPGGSQLHSGSGGLPDDLKESALKELEQLHDHGLRVSWPTGGLKRKAAALGGGERSISTGQAHSLDRMRPKSVAVQAAEEDVLAELERCGLKVRRL